MKFIITITCLLCSMITLHAQSMPDVNKLRSMSPAELAKYKEEMLKTASAKAKALSSQYDIKIDETRLPDFEIKPPLRDVAKIATLPVSPPSLQSIQTSLEQSRKQIEAVSTPAIDKEVTQLIASKTAPELQSSAVAMWYQDKPVAALLTAIGSVQKNGHEMVGWNNLAALYNMAGLEEKAIPILMNQLAANPNNSLLLNNMGQAFLGLGDLASAKNYLGQCLAIDELNPEANHSMGMIRMFEKQYDLAQQSFEKELQVAHRRSTLALMKKQGYEFNLLDLRKKRTGVPSKDYFSEIALHKFRIPGLPETSAETAAWKKKHEGFAQSIMEELAFWMAASEMTDEDRQWDGHRPPGIYSDLVDELLHELGDQMAPLLGLYDESDAAAVADMGTAYWKKRSETICPSPPLTPGGGSELIAAYQQKCCSMLKPIIDGYMANRNAFTRARINIAEARWKEYINGMINIVQLDPTRANKKLVYATVANFIAFQGSTFATAIALEDPASCMTGLTDAEADSIIASKRSVDVNCPSWLNIDFDLGVAKLKADCSKYAIEGGKGLIAGYEKNFKTGLSTIAVGVGAEQKFGSMAKVSAKHMVYISYDNNNQFADFGLKGGVDVKIGTATEALVVDGIGKVGTTLAGVEGGYSIGINSGFKSGIKGKGIFAK
jgi:tetratricopeptide (TPR) repeat protein